MNQNHHQILVVGAGLAGLTASAYLARAGYTVLLLEKTSSCGGLLNSFSREGFVFDGGARSIENSGVIKRMLKDLGIELELLPSPVSMGIGQDILPMDTLDSIDTYQRLLEKLYPENLKDIHKVFKVIGKVMKEMQVIYGFDNPVFRDFKNDKEYIFKELLPWLGRFLLAVSRMNRMDEPIEQFLEKISDNQSLVDIIDQHFFKNTPMFFALGYYYVYMDYLYPKGSTGRLAEGLVKKIQELGGNIQLSTEVTTVDPLNNTVFDSKGNSYSYDTLLWCSDLKTLYRNLDVSKLPQDVQSSIAAVRSSMEASRGGDSIFTLYLGVDTPVENFGAITHGHLFYTPSKEGLGELFRSDLDQLIESFSSVSREAIIDWVIKYCERTTYEISIPSLRDPSLSPEGKTGVIVSFLFEYELVKKVLEAGWYDVFKVAVEDYMIDTLDRSIFPGLKSSILLRFSSSPLSIEKTYGSSEGGITGWTFTKPSPVINSLRKIPKSVTTPVSNIFQAGQWAYSPAGIPTAILTGWYASEAIKKKDTGKN